MAMATAIDAMIRSKYGEPSFSRMNMTKTNIPNVPAIQNPRTQIMCVIWIIGSVRHSAK